MSTKSHKEVVRLDDQPTTIESALAQLRDYNERYGMSIENLLNILQNQFSRIYEMTDRIGDEKLQEEIVNSLGENETLVVLLKERTGWDTFYKIGNIAYSLSETISRMDK